MKEITHHDQDLNINTKTVFHYSKKVPFTRICVLSIWHPISDMSLDSVAINWIGRKAGSSC